MLYTSSAWKCLFSYPEDEGSTFLQKSAPNYQSARRHVPEDPSLNTYLREKLSLEKKICWMIYGSVFRRQICVNNRQVKEKITLLKLTLHLIC
jgi:hypothetical protein